MQISEILSWVGVGIAVLGGLMLIYAAFGTSFSWGILCLLFAPVSIAYIVTHWYESKNAVLVSSVGWALFIIGALIET